MLLSYFVDKGEEGGALNQLIGVVSNTVILLQVGRWDSGC